MRLRALYIDQLYRLKHVLREKRRNYLHSLRSERETLCSIHDQAKDTISERKMYQKLKALNKYQKRNGVEAILYKKFLEKRQKVCTNQNSSDDCFTFNRTLFVLCFCRVEMERYKHHQDHHSICAVYSLKEV